MDQQDEEAPSLISVDQSQSALVDSVTAQVHDMSITKVPLTIVTGDATDIEKALTVTQEGQSSQEWLELGNGCICCSIKDSGVNAIESLMDRRGTFDYIMLETSGLADPGNLAPLFWVDEGLGSSIYLDGIVTLVDAKNILLSLDEKVVVELEGHHPGGPHMTTAHLQISHADVIVINKCDSVTSKQLSDVEARVRAINGLAKIHKTQYSQVPQLESFLLDLHAYDGVDSLDTANQAHSHLDPSISTTTLPLPPLTLSQLSALETWLRSILWESTLPSPTNHPLPPETSFHRIKGRVFTTNGAVKMLQGVRDVFEIVDLDDGRADKDETVMRAEGKMVLIGRGLGSVDLSGSLEMCLGFAAGKEA
ncbi:hypothetical protein ACLMJK_005169 [Lecanora helva]